MFFGCDHFHLVWVGSVRDTLINHSGRAFGGWYVLVWVSKRWYSVDDLDKNRWLTAAFFGGPNDLDNGG